MQRPWLRASADRVHSARPGDDVCAGGAQRGLVSPAATAPQSEAGRAERVRRSAQNRTASARMCALQDPVQAASRARGEKTTATPPRGAYRGQGVSHRAGEHFAHGAERHRHRDFGVHTVDRGASARRESNNPPGSYTLAIKYMHA